MKEKYQEELSEDTAVMDKASIILYNDDYNTFDHVIHCLVTICGHEVIAAEQCAYIVHTTGKCVVKYGYPEDLTPKCGSLRDRGLTAAIE